MRAGAGERRGILAARTLADSHPALLPWLEPGASVLDVGSGSGTLTAEIARRVDPGLVVGLEINPDLARLADEQHPSSRIPNLVFSVGDIRDVLWEGRFDVVNAARTLQWIPDRGAALARMVRATAPGGRLVVLDVDHARAVWSRPPRDWMRFTSAFLTWRSAQGLDNRVGSHLAGLLRAAGLTEIALARRVVRVRAGEVDFFRGAGAWRMLVESRGPQMVGAGFLGETERVRALEAFTRWMRRRDAIQTTYEVCAMGRRPWPPAGRRLRTTAGRPSRRTWPPRLAARRPRS